MTINPNLACVGAAAAAFVVVAVDIADGEASVIVALAAAGISLISIIVSAINQKTYRAHCVDIARDSGYASGYWQCALHTTTPGDAPAADRTAA